MPLTLEQITAEITAQPELKTGLTGLLKEDMLTGLKAEGVVIRTKDEEDEYITNYEKNTIGLKVEEKVKEEMSKTHNRYDQDIFEVTGLRKGPKEKTYEFNKRVLKDLKTRAEAAGGDSVLADQVKELTEKLNGYEGYVAPTEFEKLKGEYFSKEVSLKLGAGLEKKTVSVPAHITDEKAKQQFIETQRRFIKNDFLARYTAKADDKGNIVYYEGDKLLTDTKTAAPMTEGQLIEANYAGYFVPEKSGTGGAGSGKGGEKVIDTNEANLKTKEEVIKHLTEKFAAQDIKQGHPEFSKEYSRIVKDYAITE